MMHFRLLYRATSCFQTIQKVCLSIVVIICPWTPVEVVEVPYIYHNRLLRWILLKVYATNANISWGYPLHWLQVVQYGACQLYSSSNHPRQRVCQLPHMPTACEQARSKSKNVTHSNEVGWLAAQLKGQASQARLNLRFQFSTRFWIRLQRNDKYDHHILAHFWRVSSNPKFFVGSLPSSRSVSFLYSVLSFGCQKRSTSRLWLMSGRARAIGPSMDGERPPSSWAQLRIFGSHLCKLRPTLCLIHLHHHLSKMLCSMISPNSKFL